MFHASCVYASLFESIIPKDNEILTGRDRISHPYIIDVENFNQGPTAFLTLTCILLHPVVSYIPYLFYALKKGGEAGILRRRIPYRIDGILDGDRPLLVDEDHMNMSIESDLWECPPPEHSSGETREQALMVQALSPLRFKVMGRYTHRFDAAALTACLHRRMQTLCSQYGGNDTAGEYRFSEGFRVAENRLEWKDYTHYSARQKKAMRLGGAMGTLEVEGKFSEYETALFRFAEIFHAGKNTNFGLGKLKLFYLNQRGENDR